jgi:hypothetical protein
MHMFFMLFQWFFHAFSGIPLAVGRDGCAATSYSGVMRKIGNLAHDAVVSLHSAGVWINSD